MTYNELLPKAQQIVDARQEEYALDRLTFKLETINEKKMVLKKVQTDLKKLEEDLKELCEHKVGYPSCGWQPRRTTEH